MVASVGEPDIKIDNKSVDGTVEVTDMNCRTSYWQWSLWSRQEGLWKDVHKFAAEIFKEIGKEYNQTEF
jgi:hypothetical protein